MGQTATYAGASAAASVATGVSKGLLAAVLSVSAYGAFALSQTLLAYVTLFCEFGLFVAAARLSALASDSDQRREIVGAAVVAYVPVAAIFVALILGSSLFVDQVFHVHVAGALRLVAVLAIGWPFTFVGLQLAQGVGRLHVSALTTLLANVLFLCALFGMRAASAHTPLALVLGLQSVSLLIGGSLLVRWLRPRFKNLRGRITNLVNDAKRYGFQVYVGRVLALATYNMDVLMLAAMTSARVVAYYALAGAIAAAAGLPVTGLATATFSRMAWSDRLQTSWLTFSWWVGLATVPVVWALTSVAVGTVFSSEYSPVVGLVIPLALATTVRGVTGIYNSFLSAHGRGRELRNAGIVLTGSNLVLNFALIPPFGAQGAAWASLIALLANWGAHVVGYRHVVAESRSNSAVTAFRRADESGDPAGACSPQEAI
jgi:O-antigen/teichoic acid export membrane protein